MSLYQSSPATTASTATFTARTATALRRRGLAQRSRHRVLPFALPSRSATPSPSHLVHPVSCDISSPPTLSSPRHSHSPRKCHPPSTQLVVFRFVRLFTCTHVCAFALCSNIICTTRHFVCAQYYTRTNGVAECERTRRYAHARDLVCLCVRPGSPKLTCILEAVTCNGRC